jgi:L-methionine (R)-S-oxide reductase
MALAPRFRKPWVELTNVVKHSRDRDLLLRQATRILNAQVPHYHWVGIYLVEGDELVLRAWSGPEATQHGRIPLGMGICGLAARTGRTINVPDVSRDPRYLACFPHTRAEIVVPIRGRSGVLGEVDIDSDEPSAFTREDEEFLEMVANLLAPALEAFGGPGT